MDSIDTNVVREARKAKAHPGVTGFFEETSASREPVYLSAVSVGELRRGVELNRHRGDAEQAKPLEAWLDSIVAQFADNILAFDADAAQVWGRLRAPNPDRATDKQIAAIAVVNDLTLVTRNTADFRGTGVKLRDPFSPVAPLA